MGGWLLCPRAMPPVTQGIGFQPIFAKACTYIYPDAPRRGKRFPAKIHYKNSAIKWRIWHRGTALVSTPHAELGNSACGVGIFPTSCLPSPHAVFTGKPCSFCRYNARTRYLLNIEPQNTPLQLFDYQTPFDLSHYFSFGVAKCRPTPKTPPKTSPQRKIFTNSTWRADKKLRREAMPKNIGSGFPPPYYQSSFCSISRNSFSLITISSGKLILRSTSKCASSETM